jgi:hypothetical protein
MRLLWLVLLVGALLLPAQAKAQELPGQGNAELYVTLLYDPDGDGNEEGTGAAVAVYLRESGSTQEYVSFTNQNSTAGFLVQDGRTYIVEAYPPQTRFFYYWICNGFIPVDESPEFLILHCDEKFFIRLPWASWG